MRITGSGRTPLQSIAMWTSDTSTFRISAARGGPAAVGLLTFATRQPSWVAKLAVGAAMLVVLAITLLLIIPALVIGLVVFFAGALAAGIRGQIRQMLGGGWRGDGRRNVRVLARREQDL